MFKIQYNSRSAGAKIFFDDFATRDAWQAAQGNAQPQLSLLPATNVIETTDNFVIELVAPGLTHEDLDISIRDNEIQVRFEPTDSTFESVQNRREWRSEYRLMPFERSFELNGDVLDLWSLSVTSADGLIRLSIPKRDKVRGRIAPMIPFSWN